MNRGMEWQPNPYEINIAYNVGGSQLSHTQSKFIDFNDFIDYCSS